MTSMLRVSSESEYSDEELSDEPSPQKSLAEKYHCPNCPNISLSLKSYHRHLRSHLSCYSAYECKECLVSFHLKDVYLQHKEEEQAKRKSEKHKLRSSLVCTICKKPFFTLCAFNRHKLKHQGPPYKCPICKETFPTFSSRSRHVKNHVIKCSLCEIYFQEHSELMNHISVVHRLKGKDVKIEPIVPVSPENISSSESETEEQENSWSEKNFICFVCEQRFASEESMNTHLKAHKLFACSECPQFFPCLSHLQEHELSHEGVFKLEPLNNKAVPGQDVSLYQPGTVAEIQAFGPVFSTEDLDKSEKPILDFDNLLHFNWLVKFTLEVKAFDLPLPIPVSEKVSHIISLLNIQLTYSTGLVDMGKNYQYFANILKTLSSISSEHFLKLAELKNNSETYI